MRLALTFTILAGIFGVVVIWITKPAQDVRLDREIEQSLKGWARTSGALSSALERMSQTTMSMGPRPAAQAPIDHESIPLPVPDEPVSDEPYVEQILNQISDARQLSERMAILSALLDSPAPSLARAQVALIELSVDRVSGKQADPHLVQKYFGTAAEVYLENTPDSVTAAEGLARAIGAQSEEAGRVILARKFSVFHPEEEEVLKRALNARNLEYPGTSN